MDIYQINGHTDIYYTYSYRVAAFVKKKTPLQLFGPFLIPDVFTIDRSLYINYLWWKHIQIDL